MPMRIWLLITSVKAGNRIKQETEKEYFYIFPSKIAI